MKKFHPCLSNHRKDKSARYSVQAGCNLGTEPTITSCIATSSRSSKPKETLMRKLGFLTAVLLLSAAWMVGQTSSSSSSGSSQSGGNATSIEGCLSGSAGSYTLTDASGQTYQLQGDSSKLDKEVGHQVRIRGMASGGSSADTPGAGGATPPGSASTGTNPSTTSQIGGARGNQFTVKSVHKVADTCSSSPSAK